jgi:hypothetical protein
MKGLGQGTPWGRIAAMAAVAGTALLWANSPSAQNVPLQGSALVIDREGYVWQSSGSAIRRCTFQESSYRPLCSEWR